MKSRLPRCCKAKCEFNCFSSEAINLFIINGQWHCDAIASTMGKKGAATASSLWYSCSWRRKGTRRRRTSERNGETWRDTQWPSPLTKKTGWLHYCTFLIISTKHFLLLCARTVSHGSVVGRWQTPPPPRRIHSIDSPRRDNSSSQGVKVWGVAIRCFIQEHCSISSTSIVNYISRQSLWQSTRSAKDP